MTSPFKLLPPALRIDKGRARPFNEDWAEYETPQDPDLLATKGILFVLADGMGGHGEGQEASRTAVKTVISTYYEDTSPDVKASLVRAFQAANTRVYRISRRARGERTVGTTLVAAVIRDDELYVAHVGDSRAYLVRGNAIQQLTEDHSWVAEQQRAGVLTEKQARIHPQRGVITRAIGAERDVEVDTSRHRLAAGDAVVLCSDGLTGQMADEEIREHVTRFSPREAAQRMVDLVNQRGGFDNISVIVARSLPPQPVRPRLSAVPILGLVVALLFIALAIFGAWRLVISRPSVTAPGEGGPGAVTEVTPTPVAPSPSPTGVGTPVGPALAPAATVRPTASLKPTSTRTLPPTPRPTPTPPPQPTATATATQGPVRRPGPPPATQPPGPPATDTPASLPTDTPPLPPTNTPPSPTQPVPEPSPTQDV